jgi:hypothetical protein
VTAPQQFLDKKRQERTKGKLAGLEAQIKELKELGASYREIAEYLLQEHGLTVTPSGLQKHLKGLTTKRAAKAAIEVCATETRQQTQPEAQPHSPALCPPPGKASTPNETFEEVRQVESARIQNRGEFAADDVLTTYRLGSPQHKETLAQYRQRKNQSKT